MTRTTDELRYLLVSLPPSKVMSSYVSLWPWWFLQSDQSVCSVREIRSTNSTRVVLKSVSHDGNVGAAMSIQHEERVENRDSLRTDLK